MVIGHTDWRRALSGYLVCTGLGCQLELMSDSLVARGVDRRNVLETEVPDHLREQERRHKGSAGTIDVDHDVPAGLVVELACEPAATHAHGDMLQASPSCTLAPQLSAGVQADMAKTISTALRVSSLRGAALRHTQAA